MNPPFTVSEFFAVFTRYNTAVWPAPVVFYVLAGATIVWAARPDPRLDPWVAAVLAFLWAWMGAVYHWLFFIEINPAAGLFGAVFVAQAFVFLWAGVLTDRLRFRFTRDVFGYTGAAFLTYALALYPAVGALAGHGFPDGPTLGLPCPTTIATFGLLLWAARPVPLGVLAIPFAWSLLGTTAALRFGVVEDLGLVLAGVLGCALVVVKNRRLATHAGMGAQPA